MNLKNIIIFIILLGVGTLIGGYLFRDTQPRSFLAVDRCNDTCFNTNELLGILGSVGVQQLPDFVPFVVEETEKTIVIEPPIKKAPIHYVIIPKKDIKDIADISIEDTEYIMDAYAVIAKIIKERGIKEYKIYTNGPGYQTVNYLHFHILAED